MSQPWVPSTFSVFPAQGVTAYAPTNVYKNASSLASAIGLGNMSLTGSETDPNGGTLAVLLAETRGDGTHDARARLNPDRRRLAHDLLGLSEGRRPSRIAN